LFVFVTCCLLVVVVLCFCELWFVLSDWGTKEHEVWTRTNKYLYRSRKSVFMCLNMEDALKYRCLASQWRVSVHIAHRTYAFRSRQFNMASKFRDKQTTVREGRKHSSTAVRHSPLSHLESARTPCKAAAQAQEMTFEPWEGLAWCTWYNLSYVVIAGCLKLLQNTQLSQCT